MSTTKRTVAIGVSAAAAAAVLVLGANFVANAAGSTTTPSPSTSSSTGTTGTAPQGQPPAGAPRGPGGPGDGTHAGPGETLLTGSTADSVKAAALKAVPGATIVRVETDSGPAKYEAHVTTSDGTQKTVKINADFSVASVQDGMGAGPAGRQGPPPGAPSGTAPSGTTSGGASA